MGAANRLLTTSRQEIRQVPKIKAYLDRKSRNSGNTADSYLRALALVQEFLNTKYINNRGHGKKPISVNHLDSVFLNGNNNKKKAQVDVYAFLDSFVSYCSADRGLSPNTTELYLHGVKGFLEHCDIEINPAKFKNRVTMPKNRREDAQAIDDSDIRKLLLACTNLRLKAYLLILASGALRAREALGLRLCDVNFSLTPTKVHVRAENAKTKVPRDIYISEEATRYLKQFIAWKYSAKTASGQLLRQQTQDDLIFRIHNQNELGAKWLYAKMLSQFQRLLKTTGLEERKIDKNNNGQRRRSITFHSFRRFAKTVIATHTSTDYSEWFLGHAKSPYFVQKELDRRMSYATKCMPFLTFIDYSKLEESAAATQSDVEALMMKDANKDREIETLKQELQIQKRENEMLKQRDSGNTDRISKLETELKGLHDMLKPLDALQNELSEIRKQTDKLHKKGII